MPRHYLKQWWCIVKFTFWNKFCWNLNKNTKMQSKNLFENVICKMASIVPQKFCVPSAYWFSVNNLFVFTMSLCFTTSSYTYQFYVIYFWWMDYILNGRYSAQRYWLPVVAVKPINCMIQRNVAILIFLLYSLKYALDSSLSDKYWFGFLCILLLYPQM